jgi:hypothetical protein
MYDLPRLTFAFYFVTSLNILSKGMLNQVNRRSNTIGSTTRLQGTSTLLGFREVAFA